MPHFERVSHTNKDEVKRLLERARENLVDIQLEVSFSQAHLKLVQCRKLRLDRRLEEIAEELRRLEEKGEKKE